MTGSTRVLRLPWMPAGTRIGLGEWLAAGRLHYATDVVHGLENAPAALDRLFAGANRGKLMLQVAENR